MNDDKYKIVIISINYPDASIEPGGAKVVSAYIWGLKTIGAATWPVTPSRQKLGGSPRRECS